MVTWVSGYDSRMSQAWRVAKRQQIAEQCSLPRDVESREPTHWSMKTRFGTWPSEGRRRDGGQDVRVAPVAAGRLAPRVDLTMPSGDDDGADGQLLGSGRYAN